MSDAPSDATASPRRLALATTSGSSGKTTTVCAVAAIAAERGQRVLVVDTDWQLDASRWLGFDEAELGGRTTLLDVLLDRTRIVDAPVASTTVDGVDLLPASPAMKDAGRLLAGKIGAEQQLRRALDDIDDRYDLILIDCRAGTELPTLAGLVAADAVVGASQAGMKELRNTLSLETFVNDVADGYGRPVQLVGILPCNVPAHGAAYKEALEIAAETFGELLLPPIRHSVSVTEAHAERRPLTSRARWRPVADDYRAAVDALTARGALPVGSPA